MCISMLLVPKSPGGVWLFDKCLPLVYTEFGYADIRGLVLLNNMVMNQCRGKVWLQCDAGKNVTNIVIRE